MLRHALSAGWTSGFTMYQLKKLAAKQQSLEFSQMQLFHSAQVDPGWQNSPLHRTWIGDGCYNVGIYHMIICIMCFGNVLLKISSLVILKVVNICWSWSDGWVLIAFSCCSWSKVVCAKKKSQWGMWPVSWQSKHMTDLALNTCATYFRTWHQNFACERFLPRQSQAHVHNLHAGVW